MQRLQRPDGTEEELLDNGIAAGDVQGRGHGLVSPLGFFVRPPCGGQLSFGCHGSAGTNG
jgi:hypothetical protein